MPCAASGLIGCDQALALLLAGAAPLGAESIRLEQAHGRVLARPVIAPRQRPCAPLAAMDGYAIRTADLEAMRSGLRIIGAAYPGGGDPLTVGPGEAVRVTTGAVLPTFADRVVIDEAIRVEDGRVRLFDEPCRRDHVRAPGSDFGAGDVLVAAGRRLNAPALIAAAAAEAAWVAVARRPSVAILITGDEVAGPGACADQPNKTPDSASFGVTGLVEAWGGRVTVRGACPDQADKLSQALAALLDQVDVVVMIGGASLSERDFGRGGACSVGARPLFAGVAMKPGKPVWAAAKGGRFIVGLPGNPVAALVAGRLFLAPLIAELSGRGAAKASAWTPLTTLAPLSPGGDRDCFLTAEQTVDGVRPLSVQTSSVHAELAACDGLIRRRAGAPPETAGGLVEWLGL